MRRDLVTALVALVPLCASLGAQAQAVPRGTTPVVAEHRPARYPGVLAEVGGGLLGVGISLGIAGLIAADTSCSAGAYGCIGSGLGAGVGYVLSSMILVPAGVTLFGRWMNHRGGFGASLLGTILGALPGALLGFGLSAAASGLDSDVRSGLLIGSVIGFSVGGAVLAFELSSDPQ